MLHASGAAQANSGEKGDAAKKDKTKSAALKDRAPLRVSAFIVHTVPFAEAVTSTGTLIAEEGVELQAETSGKGYRLASMKVRASRRAICSSA